MIRTPDQRVRVFISSTLAELSAEREVVRKAINHLHLIPVYFESGARPHSPRELYKAYLFQSHVFIGIYWQQYGWVAPGMNISGIEDEYQLANKMPKLIYIKKPAQDREPSLIDMLEHIKAKESVSYKYFTTLEELEELVKSDLVVMLSERFERSLGDEHGSIPLGDGLPTNLPHEYSSFIGREEQVASLGKLIAQEHIRLLTLTGPGGVGKTRLALKVAANLMDSYADGVWLVDLAPLTNPTLVVQSVMNVLGIHEGEGRPMIQQLCDALVNKTLLLILDNCEHILEGVVQLVRTLLCTAPDIQILATSREPLGIIGEVIQCIPSLTRPKLLDDVVPDTLMAYEAVELFVDRAAAVRSDFSVTAQNALAIAEITARLDGIPLAIELAAARARLFTVEEIAARLDDRFQLLVDDQSTHPRQKTLQALIDWSYNLLTEAERRFLTRLSVFSGGWTIESAEAICSGDTIEPEDILDLLAHLIDKSFVVVDLHDGRSRYRFLDMIRQYSQDRLKEVQEINVWHKRHAEYFLIMALESNANLWGPKQGEWISRLEGEHENLRSALEWMAQDSNRKDLFLQMASSLWRFWEIRGYISEGRAILEQALDENPNAPPDLLAKGLRGAGKLARLQGDYKNATAMHKRSLALFREMGNEYKIEIARELDVLGEIAQYHGNYSQSVKLHKESLALRKEIGDKDGIAISFGHLGIIARDQGRYKPAVELLEQSLALSRESEDRLMTALALRNLGLVAFYQCDYPRAKGLFNDALELYRLLGDRLGISETLHNMGNVAKDQGHFVEAKALYMKTLQLKRELGEKRGIALSIASLAELAFYQGEYPLAAKLSEESLSQFRMLAVKRGIVFSLGLQAYVANYQGDYQRAEIIAKKCLELSTAINAPRPIAYSKEVLGLIAFASGNLEAADNLLHEAFNIFHQVNDRRNIACILVNLARTAYRQGYHANARNYLEESISISRELDIRWSLAYSLEIMGLLERSVGHYEASSELLLESLRLSKEQRNNQGMANCLGALAGLAVLSDQHTRAAHLFAKAGNLRQTMGAKMGNHDQREYEQFLADLRDHLDDVTFEAAWSEGLSMNTDQIIEEFWDW